MLATSPFGDFICVCVFGMFGSDVLLAGLGKMSRHCR